jgi:hexosaminidase
MIMKKILVLPFLFILCSTFAQDKELSIIPLPQSYKAKTGIFELTKKTTIIHDQETADIAHYFQKELLRYESMSLPLSVNIDDDRFSNSIILKLTASDKESEHYSLDMSKGEVVIEANSKRGIFNGVSSLLQIIRLTEPTEAKYELPCYNIKDSPTYEWRGLMLDESRHFFGVKKVKKLLDWMAFYKLNKFHWHLTDAPGWRIEIKKYPKLAYVGGIGNQSNEYAPAQYYTQEEIKEIVQYAADRYIDIIPEIDMPGHATAANKAYPEFSGGGTERFPDFTFNPGNEDVYTFLSDILEEVDALFPSQIIHLGADEVNFGRKAWEANTEINDLMKRENLSDLDEVEKYFHNRMADSLIIRNNKVAGWDEISNFDISKDHSIVFYWRSIRPHMLQKAIDNDYPLVLCPNRVFYLDYKQDSTHVRSWQKHVNSLSTIYNFSPYSLPVSYKNDTNILGIQGNIWTEIIASEERLDFMTFPRITAVAETSWNSDENKNLEKFEKRVEKHLDLYRDAGIYFFNPFDPGENKEPKI